MTAGHQAAAGTMAAGTPGTIQPILSANNPSGAASVVLNSDGSRASTGASSGSWVLPTLFAPQWEVYVHVNSGSLSAGTVDTWLPLTSTRTFTRSVTGVAACTFSFRDKDSLVVHSVQNVNIERG